MTKPNKIKQIQVTIEYASTEDLDRILRRIKRMATMGVKDYKERLNSCSYEYTMDFKQDKYIEIRVEEIDGKTHMIIPSKMNKP